MLASRVSTSVDADRCRRYPFSCFGSYCPGVLGHMAERRPSGDMRVRNRTAVSRRVWSTSNAAVIRAVQRYIEHNICAVVEQDFGTDDVFHHCRGAPVADRSRWQGRAEGRESDLCAIDVDEPAPPPACMDSRDHEMVLESTGDRDKCGSKEVPKCIRRRS